MKSATIAALGSERERGVPMAADPIAARLLVAARDHAQSDPAKALAHALEALRLTQRTRDAGGQAWGHYWLAAARNNTAEYLDALADARSALTLFTRLGRGAGEALALHQAGVACVWLGKPQRALTYCMRSLELVERHGQLTRRPALYNAIGLSHYFLGDLNGAAEAYEKGLAGPLPPGEPIRASLLMNLAIADHMRGNVRSAFKRHQAALAAAERAKQPARMAEALTNIGTIYEEQGKLDEAEALQLRAVRLAHESGAKRPEIIARASLGDIALARGDRAGAKTQYLAALKLAQGARQPYGIAQARIALANLALRGGDAAGARATLSPLLALLEETGDRQLQVVTRELLRETALLLGDAAAAAGHERAERRLQREMKAGAKRRTLWLDKFRKLKKS